MPYPVARPRIAHMDEYPPPPPGSLITLHLIDFLLNRELHV